MPVRLTRYPHLFQKAAIIVAGLLAGSTIAARVTMTLGVAPAPWIFICGGILGVVRLYWLFDWALIVISSCAGAGLIVHSAGLPYQTALVLFGALITAGIVVQSVLWRSFKAGDR